MSEAATQVTSTLGEMIRQHRLAASLSQEVLADRAGLSVDAVQAIERGRRRAPRADTIVRLADALELGPDARGNLIAAAVSSSGESLHFRVDVMSPSDTFHPDQRLPTGGFLGSLAAESLVARADELASLQIAIDAAMVGDGRTVLLTGEAGVGKTRLVQEATREALSRGFLVAAGCCYETEQSTPYYPFLEMFATAYGAAPASLRDTAGTRWPYLGAILPAHLDVPEVGGGSDEQQRVLFAAKAFLDALTEHAPLALLLDDLQWADSASLRLLRHLVHHTRSSRILILGTYRDAAVDKTHPLNDVIRDLGREGLAERLPVGRLDPGGTAVLITTILDKESMAEEIIQLIYRRTEGNPFFIHQVIRQLVERHDISWEDGNWTARAVNEIEVPETVRAVIAQRARG